MNIRKARENIEILENQMLNLQSYGGREVTCDMIEQNFTLCFPEVFFIFSSRKVTSVFPRFLKKIFLGKTNSCFPEDFYFFPREN